MEQSGFNCWGRLSGFLFCIDEAINSRKNNRTPLECFRCYIQCLNRIPEVKKSRYWTKEEDAKLVENVANCGTHKWSKISTTFDRRTPSQCLHRWMTLNKRKRGKWTKEEDEVSENFVKKFENNLTCWKLLTKAVKKYGEHNWISVEKLIPERDGSQCRERYTNCLSKSIKKGTWTKEVGVLPVAFLVFHYAYFF